MPANDVFIADPPYDLPQKSPLLLAFEGNGGLVYVAAIYGKGDRWDSRIIQLKQGGDPDDREGT